MDLCPFTSLVAMLCMIDRSEGPARFSSEAIKEGREEHRKLLP